MDGTFKTPRPVPLLPSEGGMTFRRKKRGSIIFSPPKPPAKSAPPISRVFKHTRKSPGGPQAVRFKDKCRLPSVMDSPYYNALSKELYFEQCFKVLSKIGVGSFGEVYKVQSKEDGKLYAIKKSRLKFRGDNDRKEKLEEVNKHEQIQGHLNCVKFFSAWEERQQLYIQTELCEMSLNNYAEKFQHVEEDEVWNILVDLAFGLKHLHDHNFVHMDIKPDNLFLGRDGLYKIGDFGLVLEITRDISDAQEGDPKYIAPELMQGKFTKSADIFSLGITILELACGIELPKGGVLWQQLRQGQLPLEFTCGLSNEILSLIRKMMDPNPIRRPTIDDILAESNVLKAQRKRNHICLFTKLNSVTSSLAFQLVGILRIIMSFILWPLRRYQDSCISATEAHLTPEIHLPPSDLDSTFPQSTDSSLSMEGHDSIFNHSSADELGFVWPLPSPRSLLNSDTALLVNHIQNRNKTMAPSAGEYTSVWQSSPQSNRLELRDIKMSISPKFSPMGSPQIGSPHPARTPLSIKMARTKLFQNSDDEDENIKIGPRNLLQSFDEAMM